jgi:hypothetical protein
LESGSASMELDSVEMTLVSFRAAPMSVKAKHLWCQQQPCCHSSEWA